MKRVLLVSRDPRQWLLPEQLNKKSFYESYNNTGNLVWNYSIAKVLSHPEHEVVHNTLPLTRESAEIVNANFDHVVFSFANLIDPRRKLRFQQLNEFVPWLTLPLTICSIGAQANLGQGLEFIDPIRSEAQRLFSCFANRTNSIGVRGAFTAELLTKMGFGKLVTPIGCPSFYIQGEEFKAPIPKPWEESSHAIFNDNVSSRAAFFSCAKRVFGDQFLYVTQDFVCKDTCVDAIVLELVKNRKLHIFTNFHDWRAFLKRGSLSLSSRIHGSVVAMHANVPVLITPIDRRTEELAEHIGLSRIGVTEVMRSDHPDQLLNHVDPQHLDRTYKTRLCEFLAFLKQNGLKPSPTPGAHELHFDYDKVVLGEQRVSSDDETMIDFGETHPLYQNPESYIKKVQRKVAWRDMLKSFRNFLRF